MKPIEIKPTQKNIKKVFLEDTLDRNIEVMRFCTILDSITTGSSIALDGKWGSGKTFFVKQAKMILDEYNSFLCNPIATSEASQIKEVVKRLKIVQNKDNELQPQVAVYYDAWANDNDEDPILSLIYNTLQSVDADFKIEKERALIEIVSSIGEFFTGKRVATFLEAIKGKDRLASVKSEKAVQQMMKEFFDNLLSE
ncbi:MAG: P-loop NTPase fold protein, partial [archaeon]